MNRSQAQESKASDIWVRKNNNSSRSNYQQHQQQSNNSSGIKRTSGTSKKVEATRRRGKSQMSKYTEKHTLTQ